MDQWLDWSAFGFLALLTLLDGLRQVPAGALVLRKVIGGKWAVVEPRQGYALVSWWPPLSTTVVLAAVNGRTDGEEDSRPVRPVGHVRGLLTLRVLGLLSLVSLVVVVPLAMRWFGGMGFLLSLLVVLLLSFLIAGLSFHFSRSLEISTRQRLLFALSRLNPFAAPAAEEALLERTLAGANPFAVARALMTEDEFVAWVRPTAYDLTSGNGNDTELLTQVLKRKELQSIVATRPAGVGAQSPWCPRCGSEYGASSTVCSSCEVALKV